MDENPAMVEFTRQDFTWMQKAVLADLLFKELETARTMGERIFAIVYFQHEMRNVEKAVDARIKAWNKGASLESDLAEGK